MFRRLTHLALEHSLNAAYQARLNQRGSVAEGVFWRNKSAQFARFDSLCNRLGTLPHVKIQSLLMWDAAMAPYMIL